jgi:hypothetical protein
MRIGLSSTMVTGASASAPAAEHKAANSQKALTRPGGGVLSDSDASSATASRPTHASARAHTHSHTCAIASRSRFGATFTNGTIVVAGGKTATGITRDVEYIAVDQLSPANFAQPSATPTPAATATPTPTPAATATPTPAPTPTPTPAPTPTPTPLPTATPTPAPTPTPAGA